MRALPLLASATWLVALSIHGAATQSARAEDPVEKPLPLTRTTVLKDTRVLYVVDGRQTIPPGVEITGQKGIRIQGRNGAVLEVKGAFVVHGISGTPVRVSGVRIEPGESVQQLHLDYCTFSGSNVATDGGKTTGGMITVENCSFASGGGVRVGITKGKVSVMSVTGSTGVRIRGVDPEGATNRVQAMIYGCKLTDGLEIENVYDVVVRSTLLEGSPLALRANRTLLFDSNRVASGTLEITQPRTGEFKGTTITKCDFYMQSLRIFSPAADGASDLVALDKCWFSAGNDPDLIAKVIDDSSDDPQNAVKVRLKNPSDRPHNLVTDD